MSKKMMLLALMAISAALFAMPAVASAGEWTFDAAEEFTIDNDGVHTVLTQQGASTQVTCTGVSGKGSIAAGRKGGTIANLTFTGCKESVFSSSCTTTGEAAGTINLKTLPFDNVLIEATTPGILITPPAATAPKFTTFVCGGGLVHEEVTGNGIIGHITTPACGVASKTATIDFETNGTDGVQKYMQITTTNTKFDLDAKETIFGSTTTRTAAMFGRGTITFSNARKILCEA